MDDVARRWSATRTTRTTRTDGGTAREVLLDDGRGRGGRYPCAWLRNNCQCPDCAAAPSGFRKLVIRDFPFRCAPVRLQIVNDDVLRVEWDDGHESAYGVQWLLERSFDEDRRDPCRRIGWTAESFAAVFRSFSYEDVIESDEILLQWLETLAVYGISIITNCGLEQDRITKLAGRVAFLKKTQYGETFRVEVNVDATNLAYRSSYLQLHTDLPYYEYAPGVVLLHCVVQPESDGGESEVTDGLAVCERLRSADERHYKTLSTVPVTWIDRGQDGGYRFSNVHRAPVICEDHCGRIKRIRFNEHHRDSTFPVSTDEVHGWYDAIERFVNVAYDEGMISTFKMRPGEILTFDNHRVLHGRKSYVGPRLLIGGYLDWDLVESRTRVLKSAAAAAAAAV